MTNSAFGVVVADIPFFDLRAATAARRAELHRSLDEVIDDGYFVGGAAVLAFETEFAKYVGVSECVAVGNGLDALRIGMEGLGIGPGDEVIVPGFTFYASWLAVLQVGAIPVPVDVEIAAASIDLTAVAAAITPRTKAILVVHLYGVPAQLAALRSLADGAGIFLIEDAAQSHGASSSTLMTGSVGDFAAFSFYPTKNLGALGDGGAIVTRSASVAEVARRRRSYGQGASKYEHVDTGWNSRLDSLQAAFLLNGLSRLDDLNSRRRTIAEAYLQALGAHSGVVIGSAQHSESVWHHFVLRASDRARVREYFGRKGISTDIHYPYSFYDVEPLKKYGPRASLPRSEALAREVVSLPISPWLTDEEVSYVVESLIMLPRELIAAP